MLYRGLIALSGFNAGRIPVQVVDLQKDNIHFRMGCQDLIQQSGAVMVRETGPFRIPLFLLFLKEAELIKLFSDIVVLPVQPVQHQYVKVRCSAAFLFFPEILLCVLRLPAEIAGNLLREAEVLSALAGHDTAADPFFAVSVQIGIAGIEVSFAGFHVQVNQAVQRFPVIFVCILFLRYPQKAEAEFVYQSVLLIQIILFFR